METIERDPFQSVIDDIRNNDFEYYPYESEEEEYKLQKNFGWAERIEHTHTEVEE